MGTTFIPDDSEDMTPEERNSQLSRQVGTSPVVELDITGIDRTSGGWSINYND